MKSLRLMKLVKSVIQNKAHFKMFVADQQVMEPKLTEIKLVEYFVTRDTYNEEFKTSAGVNDNDEYATEGEVVDNVRSALSANIKLKLKSKRSFREDRVLKANFATWCFSWIRS